MTAPLSARARRATGAYGHSALRQPGQISIKGAHHEVGCRHYRLACRVLRTLARGTLVIRSNAISDDGAMKLNSWDAPEYKALYRLIRTSDYAEIKGEFITADDVTGECTV